MTGNGNFVNPAVDLAQLKAGGENLTALIAEALDGSRKVIAAKNKQRHDVIKMLRLQGRYVEVTSNGDRAVFRSSGFPPASTTKAAQSAPLAVPKIRKVAHGSNSGQIVIQIKADPKASSYELRYAAAVSGGLGQWTYQLVTRLKTPVTVTGLTPGTVYAFQVRALGLLGYTDWTDSDTCMCL